MCLNIHYRAPVSRRYGLLVMAGMVFGLGLQIKLVPIIYLPLAALVMSLRPREGRLLGNRVILDMSLFAAGLVGAYIGSDLVIERGAYLTHFGQSWESHFGAVRATTEYGSPRQHPFDWRVLVKNWDVTVPAAIGVGYLLAKTGRKFNRRGCGKTDGNRETFTGDNEGNEGLRKGEECWELWQAVPLVWLGLTFAVFGIHKPWWAYYYVHTAIPMCWCAALAIGFFAEWIRGLPGTRCAKLEGRGLAGTKAWLRRVVAAGTIGLFAVCSVGWMGARVYLQVANLRAAPKIESSPVITQMRRLQPFTEYLYADKLVYSFYSGIPMVPSLAVMPIKRLWSGELDNAAIRRELVKFKPGLMLLLNDGRDVPFKDLLDTDYQIVYMDEDNRL